MPKKMREAIYDFLTYYVLFDNPKYFTNFENEILVKEGRSTTMGTREYLLDKATNKGKLEGKLETEEKNKTEFVTNLILDTNFGDAKIASLAVVSVEFVQKVRASLNKKKK